MTTTQLLTELKKKQADYQIEPFVVDFLEFWSFIHDEAPKHTLETALDFLHSIWDSHTVPFYQKYQQKGEVELHEDWVYHSFLLVWGTRGSILFPKDIVLYEIYCYKKKLFEEYLQRLFSKQIRGKRLSLLEYLIPKIINYMVPLEDIDITILKVNQWATKQLRHNYLPPTNKMLFSQMKVSQKTLERRMKGLKLIEMLQNKHYLDMALLGYETYLVIHHEKFPKQFIQYLHISVEMPVGKFSLVYIPIKNPTVLSKLNEILNPISIIQMAEHSLTWNLNQITSGIERWIGNIPVINPSNRIISTTSDFKFNLLPVIEQFRSLTDTDIKILDFLNLKGNFSSITEFSKVIGVSRGELSKRLAEYRTEKLMSRNVLFFNLGLTTLWLYISDTNQNHHWLPQISQLPLSYLYLSEETSPFSYFGNVKMSPQWINQFIRQMDRLKEESEIIYYFKPVSAVDYFKNGGVSLADTYPMEDREA